ncbi:MAG: hypothetical protein ACLFV3_06610 [Phycisphaeraceae bacterium]
MSCSSPQDDSPRDEPVADPPEAAELDPAEHPRSEERAAERAVAAVRSPGTGLQLTLLVWCAWLLGAWGLRMRMASPEVGARWMLLASLAGMAVVWPAIRLSYATVLDQLRFARLTSLSVLIEWLCLYLLLQAVVLGVALTVAWEPWQTLYVDLTLGGWTLIAAAVVGLACRWRRGWARSLGVAACLLLVLGQPLAVLVAAAVGLDGPAAWPWWGNPVATLWGLTAAPGDYVLDVWTARVVGPLLVAGGLWLALLAIPTRRGEARGGLNR